MIITIQRSFIIGSIFLLTALLGCARLPEYARPRANVQLNDLVDDSADHAAMLADAFTYRHLTLADFRAQALPPDRAMHQASINAYTCARIRPGRDTKIVVSRARYGESDIYFGSIRQIAFEAIMLPGCSWWNPALPTKNSAYVLEHEQIHFAMVELTARRLTLDAQKKLGAFLAIHPTYAEAVNEITITINQLIRSATNEALKMHTAFDEDTSLFHSPKWQRWWLEKIERELAQLQPDTPAGIAGENTGSSK